MKQKDTKSLIEMVYKNYNNREDKIEDLEIGENPIENILKYFIPSSKIKNLPRKKYDLDCMHIYNTEALEKFPENDYKRNEYAKNADIMISFFTPYARAIEITTGKRYYKKNYEHLKMLIEKINDDKYKEVNKHFEKFASLYASRGNILLLPEDNGNMNPTRYTVAQDKIEKSLYECFDNGALSSYFKSDNELRDWIKKEYLDTCFKDNAINKDSIEDKLVEFLSYLNYSSIDDVEIIYRYIDTICNIIEYRNKKFDEQN